MTGKACTNMVLSQFSLSKVLINNLKQFDVSPSAKLVLMYLSDCYNPKKAFIYPKQETIANKLGISLSSVKRAIKELNKIGLIVYETKNINKYSFTSKIFDLHNLTPKKTQNETLKRVNLLPHVHEQKKETKKELIHTNNSLKIQTSKKQNNDEILIKLSSWSFQGGEFIIKKYGKELIGKLIEVVENKKPENKGAYLRKLLENPLNALKDNNIELDNERYKRLIEDPKSFVNDKTLAEVQLASYHPNHLQNDKAIKHIAEILVRWNFPQNYILESINNNPNYFELFTAHTRVIKESFLSLGYDSYIAI